MNVAAKIEPLKAKDFASDQEVRWCPGCGDYAIINAMRKTLADIGATRESTVFVSGIGCAARFPYYMSTYGFHTIHGRAAPISTGIKLANPELDIWVASGDGDSLSIGGNHLLHLLRRNVNLQYLLFNNEIYGLTKGQYSPTSRMGTRSPSTPLGSVESPVSACEFALGSGARFVARGVDTQQKHLPGVFQRAWEHKGTSFVEILQNCIVYNDDVFAEFTAKDVAQDRQVHVSHGQPLIFGANEDKGLQVNAENLKLEVVTLGENGITESDVLVHDETNPTLARMLVTMEAPEFPVALGILYCDPAKTYDDNVLAQVQKAQNDMPNADLDAYLRRGHTWTV